MYLKSVELEGFKSFAKKTVLSFDSSVTAIVGPNGSGKSNVVEAFRFVLGEQSSKSMRSKTGADLIFKGSKTIQPYSRASVVISFDNKDKKFSFTSEENPIPLDFDEVIIEREVTKDGKNKYAINGTEVRLKDIVDILASVHVGSSGHHIISQGEADRVLSANTKERRHMIEDALGLKIYQIRIKESERKLEKTKLNMKEVQSLRRELLPHLTFLKKQVEKIEKAKELREILIEKYHDYFSHHTKILRLLDEKFQNDLITLKHQKEVLLSQIKQEELRRSGSLHDEFEITLKEISDSRLRNRYEIDELNIQIGRLEGKLALLSEKKEVISENKNIDKEIAFSFINDIESLLVLDWQTIEQAYSFKNNLKQLIDSFKTKINSNQFVEQKEIDTTLIREAENALHVLQEQRQKLQTNEETYRKTVSEIENKRKEKEQHNREKDEQYYNLLNELSKIEGFLIAGESELARLSSDKERLEEIKRNAVLLLGNDVLHVKECEVDPRSEKEQEILWKEIERLSFKLEDIGGGGGGDIISEYQQTVERDQFLSKELADLESGLVHLTHLIVDLRQTLDKEFKKGIENINKAFSDFFSTMFGGGTAFLSVVAEHKKVEEDEEEVKSDVDDNEYTFEQGIEIHVTLPHKKVKDLHMLSGGERSLTSIALLFAMSQVNPPPFLILDETDAALDEANSRRYGDMIERLSEYSQLIVVTHNRETMSRAGALYGVTVSSLGCSKLLSVKFDEATEYAK